MPTSGEARIRPTSTYNLRSNPLPKTKRVTAGVRTASSTSSKNKENKQHSAGKYKKSHIPVPVKTTPSAKIINKPAEEDTKTSTGGKPRTRVRRVPDFAKLHKSWQQSFSKGKACTKKQCTQIREFDLTKPGAVFQPRYFNGKQDAPSEDQRGEDIFQSDDEALQSILNAGLPDASQKQGRLTVAGYGGVAVTQQKPSRQTLGALPSTFQGRTNSAHNTRHMGNHQIDRESAKPGKQDYPLEQEQHKGQSGRLLSLAEQQQENEINFEADAGALASILNNAGANFQRQAPTTRQTIGAAIGVARNQGSLFSGRQSQGALRTSIYYQRPRNMNFNRVYTDFANHVLSRLSLAENMVSSSNSQPLEQPTTARTTVPPQSSAKAMNKSHVMMSAPRRLITPGTASRVLNPRQEAAFRGQDTSSSPALMAPPSALKKSNAHKSLSVKWADVLSPPSGRIATASNKDELATTLFADEDTQFLEPYSTNELAVNEGKLQAASLMAKQDDIEQLEQQAAIHRNQLQEMDEIERQLELEIQKLQQDDYLPSPPTTNSEDQKQQESHRGLEVASRPLQMIPLPTPGKVPIDDSSETRQRQYFPLPTQDSVQIAGISSSDRRAPEMLDVPLSGEGAISVQSVETAFKHSPGSPFKQNGLPFVRNHGRQESSAVQLQFHPGSEFKTHHGNNNCDIPVALYPERLHQMLNTPEKPFVEMRTYDPVTQAKNESEGLQSRVLDFRKVDGMVQAPQVMINRDGTRDRMEFKHPTPSDALNFRQPVESFSQAATQMTSRRLDRNGSNFVDDAPRLGGKASKQDSGLETDHKETNPLLPIGRVSSWMSSTPAHIQTPHAVKPHSMIKELALKQSLPSLNLPSNQHVSIKRDVPPIQTPLAMRSMSTWGREADIGASPVQFVSPVPLRSGHTLQSEHPESIHNGSAQHKSDLTGSSPSVGFTTTSTKLESGNINQLQHHLGHSDYPTSATTGTSVSELDKTSAYQSGTLSYPASETAHLATHPEPPHQQKSNSFLDQTPSSTVLDSEGNHSEPHFREDPARPPGLLNFRGQGSLSLGAELLTSGGAAAFLKSKMKPLLSTTTNQLFQEALLDEECALYACRLPSKFSTCVTEERQCLDPVAKILMDGDDMHFVPIQSKGRVYIASPVGSAFNTYSNLAN
ncbi:uncharacterized protein LOC119744938 isoform X2 [Patiria miniata]|uniref:Uncharacterized protein n=1 Tax=Patiria miniata TaxID=46514 RepID=A0A914BLB9_PATMI|nr:uncharacterized protein LOC119744938 isoform X2 [Patiria miniata]